MRSVSSKHSETVPSTPPASSRTRSQSRHVHTHTLTHERCRAEPGTPATMRRIGELLCDKLRKTERGRPSSRRKRERTKTPTPWLPAHAPVPLRLQKHSRARFKTPSTLCKDTPVWPKPQVEVRTSTHPVGLLQNACRHVAGRASRSATRGTNFARQAPLRHHIGQHPHHGGNRFLNRPSTYKMFRIPSPWR